MTSHSRPAISEADGLRMIASIPVSSMLFVENLPANVTEDVLAVLFQQYASTFIIAFHSNPKRCRAPPLHNCFSELYYIDTPASRAQNSLHQTQRPNRKPRM